MSFLRKLHEELKLTCQPTSFYLKITAIEKNTVQTTDDKTGEIQIKTCQYCGTDYGTTQQRVRLRPRIGLNKKLKRLLQRYKTEPGSLGKCQLNIVQQYLNSYNHLLVTCSICKKTSKYQCSKRPESHQKKTPPIKDSPSSQNNEITKKKKKKRKKEKEDTDKSVSESKDISRQRNTPEHTITTPLKLSTSPSVIKTTVSAGHKRTPLNTAISSKSAKKKKGKNIHQQLNQMLAKEKSGNKSGNLKDFLSTL